MMISGVKDGVGALTVDSQGRVGTMYDHEEVLLRKRLKRSTLAHAPLQIKAKTKQSDVRRLVRGEGWRRSGGGGGLTAAAAAGMRAALQSGVEFVRSRRANVLDAASGLRRRRV